MRIAEKFSLVIFGAVAILSGCAGPQAAENQAPPAKVENVVKESDLVTIKLTT